MDNLDVDVYSGLTSTPKHLPYGLEWDSEEGHALYKLRLSAPNFWVKDEPILVQRSIPSIAKSLGKRVMLVDLASGVSETSNVVIDALLQDTERHLIFVPVDIDPEISSLPDVIKDRFGSSRIKTIPFVGDFFDGIKYVGSLYEQIEGEDDWEILFVILGGMIGVLSYNTALELMKCIREILKGRKAVLAVSYSLAAENGSRGCQDAMQNFYKVPNSIFSRSKGYEHRLADLYLNRLVERFGANVDFSKFYGELEWINGHSVDGSHGKGLVDLSNMYIVSKEKQTVRLDKLDLTIMFDHGEKLHCGFNGDGYLLHYGKSEMENMGRKSQFQMKDYFLSPKETHGLAVYTLQES